MKSETHKAFTKTQINAFNAAVEQATKICEADDMIEWLAQHGVPKDFSTEYLCRADSNIFYIFINPPNEKFERKKPIYFFKDEKIDEFLNYIKASPHAKDLDLESMKATNTGTVTSHFCFVNGKVKDISSANVYFQFVNQLCFYSFKEKQYYFPDAVMYDVVNREKLKNPLFDPKTEKVAA